MVFISCEDIENSLGLCKYTSIFVVIDFSKDKLTIFIEIDLSNHKSTIFVEINLSKDKSATIS